MNIKNLEFELKYVNQVGSTLDIDERIKLELALLNLTNIHPADQTLFWGKIEGTSKDYFIAMTLQYQNVQDFPKKQFFWTNSELFSFAKLPDPRNSFKSQVETQRTFFTGQHDFVLFDNLPLSDDSQKSTFTELDRLAYVVNEIERECQIVPEGAFKLMPSWELRQAQGYYGLKIEDSIKPEKYLHFRKPSEQHFQKFIMKDNYLVHNDFLENIKGDLPVGCWSIQPNYSKTIVTLRSLLWFGYVAYHRTNSGVYGGAYIGTGIKNLDLPFITQ